MGFFPTLSSSPSDRTGINSVAPPLSNSPPLTTTTISPLVSLTKSLATTEPTSITIATITSPYSVLLQKPTTTSIEVADNSPISINGSISSVKGSNSSTKKKRVTGTPLFSNASVRSYKS